jgi:hypothetical protein
VDNKLKTLVDPLPCTCLGVAYIETETDSSGNVWAAVVCGACSKVVTSDPQAGDQASSACVRWNQANAWYPMPNTSERD